jgi:hypothetical protein
MQVAFKGILTQYFCLVLKRLVLFVRNFNLIESRQVSLRVCEMCRDTDECDLIFEYEERV